MILSRLCALSHKRLRPDGDLALDAPVRFQHPGRDGRRPFPAFRFFGGGTLGHAPPFPFRRRRLRRQDRGTACFEGGPRGQRPRPALPRCPDLQEGPMVLPVIGGGGAPAFVGRRNGTGGKLALAQRRRDAGPAHHLSRGELVPPPVGRVPFLPGRTAFPGPLERPVRSGEHPSRLRKVGSRPRRRAPPSPEAGGRLPRPGPRQHPGKCPGRHTGNERQADPRARIRQPRRPGRPLRPRPGLDRLGEGHRRSAGDRL